MTIIFGWQEKKIFAQGKTHSTTGRSQSLEYIGDKKLKNTKMFVNISNTLMKYLTNLLLSFRDTGGVMLLRIFTLLLFKAPNFPLLSNLTLNWQKKIIHTQIGCILQLWWAGWLKKLGL